MPIERPVPIESSSSRPDTSLTPSAPIVSDYAAGVFPPWVQNVIIA